MKLGEEIKRNDNDNNKTLIEHFQALALNS